MPSKLETPVLTVDVGLIHKVDTRNVENLFSMWSVFSRCASSLEEGRRLENLSWRLWNRETFCCDPVSEANATTPAISIASRSSEGHYAADVPELSGSLDSCSDEEALDFESASLSSTSEPLSIDRPRLYRQDSLNSCRSRGHERHITSGDLEKMVITIKEKKDLEPLPLSTHSYFTSPIQQAIPEVHIISPPPMVDSVGSDSAASDRSEQAPSSESSCDSERSTTSVVKGFSPSHISSSYRSPNSLTPHLPSSIPTSDIAATNITSEPVPKKKAKFMLASSDEGSTSDPSNSLERQSVQSMQPPKKRGNFYFGSSNEDDSLPKKMLAPSALSAAFQKQPKKQTSFREEVATRIIHEEQPFDDDVFETDDEDEIDESAIDDDDDSSDWEDSNEESNNVSLDEKTFFKRVESTQNLTSRPSLITLALAKGNNTLGAQVSRFPHASKSTSALQRSRTTSPNGPSLAASPDEPLMMKGKGNLRSISEAPALQQTQPIIMTTTNTTPHQLALSPRTTRRNMLSTELTVSLRQHLLWERQQKSQTANAVLKRRHTAHDVANLKQYPEKVHMDKKGDQDFNQYFSQGLGEYHSKGW